MEKLVEEPLPLKTINSILKITNDRGELKYKIKRFNTILSIKILSKASEMVDIEKISSENSDSDFYKMFLKAFGTKEFEFIFNKMLDFVSVSLNEGEYSNLSEEEDHFNGDIGLMLSVVTKVAEVNYSNFFVGDATNILKRKGV